MSVNEIYKKTSLDHKEIFKKSGLSYKKNFTDSLKELEKDKIIKREKDLKIENIYDSKDLSEKVENYKVILDQHLFNISGFTHAFPNLFQNEVKDHIFSRLYFLRPPKNLVAKKLEDKQIFIEEYKKNATEEIKKNNLSNPAIYSKSLIDAYKEYLNIETI